MYYANADQRWYGDNGMSAALKIPIDSITSDGRREIPVDAFASIYVQLHVSTYY